MRFSVFIQLTFFFCSSIHNFAGNENYLFRDETHYNFKKFFVLLFIRGKFGGYSGEILNFIFAWILAILIDFTRWRKTCSTHPAPKTLPRKFSNFKWNGIIKIWKTNFLLIKFPAKLNFPTIFAARFQAGFFLKQTISSSFSRAFDGWIEKLEISKTTFEISW